jgi:hypothetical protein
MLWACFIDFGAFLSGNLHSFQKTPVDLTIDAHRSRIVKTMGNGLLVEFASLAAE